MLWMFPVLVFLQKVFCRGPAIPQPNNHTIVCNCTSERKCCMAHTCNQRLEMIKLGKKGMLEVGNSQQARTLMSVSQLVNAKEKFLKHIKVLLQ